MDQKPLFSVLLPFYNQRDAVEPTLTSLYELENMHFELILIDDGSTDGTVQAMQSLLDYYKHEHTFFFEHQQPAGRGNCLNEALLQANASILWFPHSIQNIHEEALHDAINNLRNSSAPCLINNSNLPGDIVTWGETILEGRLPADGQMLWNRAQIPASQQFINPYLNAANGIEWLIRLGMDALEINNSFFAPSQLSGAEEPSTVDKQELILALLRRPALSSVNRQNLAELLLKLPSLSEEQASDKKNSLLEQAVKLKMRGQFSAALECVEKVLKKEPDNPEASHLKIKLLEGKRRFVEASELKHNLRAGAKAAKKHSPLDAKQIKTSLIIPTALYGKGALEHCLLSVDEHCNAATTELIIIDNASLDDTHDYLEELSEKNFFNCRVITNQKNAGFAASVNQALEVAKGPYACILHNDVELSSPAITQLETLMDSYPSYALMGPLADSSLNPDQLVSSKDLYASEVEETDYLDSFCLMIRKETGLRMDEEFTLAFFDDIDLSFQARQQNFKVGIATQIEVNHHYGTTTFAMDLDTESELYWKNIAYFNDKWEVQTYSEEDLQAKSRFEQLLTLDDWVNPLYPEEAIQNKFDELFTDEVKTEIEKTTFEPEILLKLMHLMMVMQKREVLRRLEEKAADLVLPASLIYEMVRFYFHRNVFSRCLFYLNQLTAQQESLQSDLYRLAILIDEKKMEKAIPMLTELLDKAPANPMLYKLAGDIHAFENNTEEAGSFYSLANQINPFQFSNSEEEIRLNS